MRITVNYGISNTLSKDVPEGTTLGDVLNDKNFQGVLGFGANVVGKIDGQTQEPSYRLQSGDEVDVEVRANTKAEQRRLLPTFSLVLRTTRSRRT